MRTIILTKGLIASGKSTWTIEQQKRYPGKYKRLNRDILRDMLDNGLYSEKNEEFIIDLRDRTVEHALMKGYDAIVDDTNFSDKNWTRMCEIARKIGDVRVMEKYFEVTLKEAIKRNSTRINPIPEHAIKLMYEKYIKHRKVEVRDEYFPKKLPAYMKSHGTSGKEKAIIVDIDGTLALNTDRGYYDMTQVLNDKPHIPVVDLVSKYRDDGCKVVVVSGRDTSCSEDTKTWFSYHGIQFDKLFMRNIGDNRRDAIVKEEIYHQLIEPFFDVIAVIDDRPQVIKMFRGLGLFVLQVNDIEF